MTYAREPWYIGLLPVWCGVLGAAIAIVVDGSKSPLVLVLGFAGLLLGSR